MWSDEFPDPDYPAARRAIHEQLKKGLSPNLVYHNLAHTFEDVLPAAERLAAMEKVTSADLVLLQTAACFHDAGYLERYQDNESIAVRISREVLPGFGYSPVQVETVAGLILATRMPQSPRNHLEMILADADLDSLGREDYWSLRVALRQEYAHYLAAVSDQDWLKDQLDFISKHAYFTQSASRLRDETKRAHIRQLIAMLGQDQEA